MAYILKMCITISLIIYFLVYDKLNDVIAKVSKMRVYDVTLSSKMIIIIFK